MERHKSLLEQHLLTIFNTSSSPMYVCAGEDLNVIYANEATLRIWGKDNSIIGKPFVEALPEIKNQPFPKLLRNVYETGVPYHTEQDRADLQTYDKLQTYYFKFTYRPLREQDGKIWAVLCTATDVTELVLAKRETEASRKHLYEMIMQAPIAICIVKGPRHIIEIANDKILELWGTTDRVIGKPIFEGIPEVRGQGFEELIDKVYHTGQRFTAFERPADLPRSGGIERFYLNFLYEPLRDSGGKIFGVMAVASDVTEQVLARKKKDDFIGIASHELKTPLTTLKASIQLIERFTSNNENSKLPGLAKQSASSVNKLSYLIEDLLNVSKLNEGQLNLQKEEFILSQVVEECCQHVRMQGRHTIKLQGDVELRVVADRQRIDQVIVNLVNNAVKYAPNSENIIVEIQNLGKWAKLSVTDFGPGIPKDKLEHLFKRYYRVDSEGKQISGLGLGLYIANEIIEKHEGKMGVYSEFGSGSTFWFTLPLT